MDKVTIENLSDYDGKEIELRGWVYNTRSIGKIWFIIFRDGTGLVQGVVVKGEASNEAFALKQKLNQEDSVIIIGTVKKEPRSVGGYELGIKDITIVNHVTEEYPISPKEHGADFLMSNRHLWLRSKRQNAIMRVRHQVVKAIRDFFDINGFTLIDSPIFTGNAVEGTTTLFEVDYFERSAYLTQSGQLYQEAGATAFGKTYCFGPTFRAEKSKTRRHLTEFWMVEPEMAYVDIDENMTWAENLVSYILDKVLAKCKNELNTLERDISKLENMKPPFPRITYDEAFKLLKERGSTFEYGNDFGAPDETILSNQFDKPIMIHRWPAEIKAFYMRQNDDGKTVAAMDVLFPGIGEIVGGSQREERLDVLKTKCADFDIPEEDLWWYLDTRKFGTVPHAGFGLGFERMVMFATGMTNIRDVIPFPRTPQNAEF